MWFGETGIRDEYRGKIGKKKNYPMLRSHLVPINPWNQRDAISAKANGRLPLAHGIIPPAPPIPPGFARPRNAYPFDFWPNPPWHPEPGFEDDESVQYPVTLIHDDEEVRDLWRSTRPLMWPVQNEDNWRNKRYLGAGAYGCAGLWCQHDEENTIINVSTITE